MLPNWLAAFLVGGTFALVLGYFVARKSAARKPIQGGAMSHLFHYLGAALVVAPAPMLLAAGFIFRTSFGETAALCLGSLGGGFLLLMVFAFFELQKNRQPT